ncbi:hypothetical protein SPI_04413 [Niveomyces insectorum RCEF 264]|uniref:Uncharacterized protein n=1 Tax=Niveomyces insectorum RCEF 264 TaxID=1081102 RepID=A0A167VQ88_9HYPO|nr:hypothetical protein SPI_04413 [Niveomyces insectorum RCEF 264]
MRHIKIHLRRLLSRLSRRVRALCYQRCTCACCSCHLQPQRPAPDEVRDDQSGVLARRISFRPPLTPFLLENIFPYPETGTPSQRAVTQHLVSQPSEPSMYDNPSPPSPSLDDILATLDDALAHIRYAVCGTTALVLWSRLLASRPPPFLSPATSHLMPGVTIVCAGTTRDVLASWAASKGLYLDPNHPDVLGLPAGPARHPRGQAIVPVYIRWLDDEIPRAAVVDVAGVPVLTLPALLDLAAWDYAHSQAAAADPAVRDKLARVIVYLLRRIAECGYGRLLLSSPQSAPSSAQPPETGNQFSDTVPALLDPLFYDVFPRAYPGAEELFAAAGLALPADGTTDAAASTSRRQLDHPNRAKLLPRRSFTRSRLNKSLQSLRYEARVRLRRLKTKFCKYLGLSL